MLKFNIPNTRPSLEDIKKARENTGGYSGPTPQPGKYDTRLVQLNLTESRSGNLMFKARLAIEDYESQGVYKGFVFTHYVVIPYNSSANSFSFQLRNLDDFMSVITHGTGNSNTCYAALEKSDFAGVENSDTDVQLAEFAGNKIGDFIKVVVVSGLQDDTQDPEKQWARVKYIDVAATKALQDGNPPEADGFENLGDMELM